MEVQLSMFSMEPETFDADAGELQEVLKRGSGYEGGCLRIYAAYQLLDDSRFVMFLADEFGIGGHSFRSGFVDYNRSGLTISHWKANERRKWTWRQIANTYRSMICAGTFPAEDVIRLFDAARKAGKGAPMPRMHYGGDH